MSPAAAVGVKVVRAAPARSAHAPLQQGAERLGARMSSALPGAGDRAAWEASEPGWVHPTTFWRCSLPQLNTH